MASESAHRRRCCDLVMKGGITSGILYPPAICRIAEKFHLVGIGGTSAGAIAACAAAAAEYRRRHGDDDGYRLLEELPGDLAGPGRLLGLFRPDRSTRELFDLMVDVAGMKRRWWVGRKLLLLRLAWKLFRREKTLRPAIANGFGLCTGMGNGNPPLPGEIDPIGTWLADRIDEIAGKSGDDPLIFDDLWTAPVPRHLQSILAGHGRRSVDLRAVTTCLTYGRPFELPFKERKFAFDEAEWRRLFPERVVDYLVRVAATIESTRLRKDGRLPLPVQGSLPVVVAARMSLSFPGLFTAVPLYAINDEKDDQPLERVWFSDGGITSNLPIHFFDGLLPRWPTLAINLQYTGQDGVPERRNADADLTYMIRTIGEGTADLPHRFDAADSMVGKLIGFLNDGIFRSAQVWHDNAFLKLPGFRDRVIEIWLRPDEGGMNLDMPAETIRRLIDRGNAAGIRLRDRFAGTADPINWEGHRWTRLRSGLAGLTPYLRAFERAARSGEGLSRLLNAREAPPYYRFETNKQLEAASAAISKLRQLVRELDELARAAQLEGADAPFGDGPRPPVEIGSRAPI